MQYSDFLRNKQIRFVPQGIDDAVINPKLFHYQQDIVKWALKLGRSAIFADCGLGKSFMQIEWANNICRHTGGKVLILAPLAVSHQTIHEGKKLGVDISYYGGDADIQIINYDKLDHVDVSLFSGVVLDESSILKNFTGKIRDKIIETFINTPFKLACTATPSPNDFMELGNHAEFLGVMSRSEMLAMFFVHDGGETSKWRIKGHAQDVFWRWVSSWAVMISKPSDLGYSDEGFTLPSITYHQHIVRVDTPSDGFLFAVHANTLQERIIERRNTCDLRSQFCADIVNKSEGKFLIWCDRNDEADYLKRNIDDAIEVRGSDDPDQKSERLLGFGLGEVKRLISKPKIAGFGMNWQSCNQMAFVGLSDSYEAFYQAIRRCWRFGQKKPVDVHIIIAETEGNVLANIRRKDAQSKEMQAMMLDHMSVFQSDNIRATSRQTIAYNPTVSFKEPSFI